MRHHLPLAGLCLAVYLVMTGMGMAAIALPGKYLAASGNLDSSGWLASCFAISYLLCQYPSGRWADTRGYRPVLALGCMLVGVAALVFHFAHTPLLIYWGRFIQGAGEAPIWAAAPALLGRIYPGMKGRVMGLYNAVFHLGLMSGPLLAPVVVRAAGADPFLVFCGSCLAATMLVLLTVRERDTGGRTKRGNAGPRLLIAPELWPMLCGVPVYGATYGLLVSCIPVYLTAVAGYSSGQLGTFLLTSYAGIAASQLLGGALSDRLGRRGFSTAGLLLQGLALCRFAGILPLSLYVTAAILGLGLGMFSVASMAWLSDHTPEQNKGAMSGVYYLIWGGGYFCGPLMINQTGLETGLTVLVACALAVAALLAVSVGIRKFTNSDTFLSRFY